MECGGGRKNDTTVGGSLWHSLQATSLVPLEFADGLECGLVARYDVRFFDSLRHFECWHVWGILAG